MVPETPKIRHDPPPPARLSPWEGGGAGNLFFQDLESALLNILEPKDKT